MELYSNICFVWTIFLTIMLPIGAFLYITYERIYDKRCDDPQDVLIGAAAIWLFLGVGAQIFMPIAIIAGLFHLGYFTIDYISHAIAQKIREIIESEEV